MISYLFALAIAFEAPPATIGASPVDALVARAGKQVEQFWKTMGGVHCTESVEQTKLAENGKPTLRRQAAFDYLVLMQMNGEELSMDESRVNRGKAPKPGDQSLLTTSGFSTLVLIFHPYYRDSFRYELEPESDGPLNKVHFAQIPGRRSPAVLKLHSREFPIEWEGDAWIDRRTGVITRIQAGLREPLTDIGLQKLSAVVTYGPVALKQLPEPAWLPQEARIEAQTVHQHWINDHIFSAYKEFGVTVDVTPQGPAAKASGR